MRRVWRIAGSVLAVLIVGGIVVYLTRPKQLITAAGRARVPLTKVDHAPFDRLLHEYVDNDGRVAYARWKANAADLRALQDYLASLCAADLQETAPREVRLAYWINAYNALTLAGILDRYPLKSIRDYTPDWKNGFHFWNDLRLEIGGEKHSLHNIEHDILRKMDEPRIHFAIVCASRGCPPLRPEAYVAGKVEAQLADNARRFFANPANFRADESEHAIGLSELLSWYSQDFAKSPREMVRVLRPYFPGADKLTWLDADDLTVEYPRPYDWGLNDQQAAAEKEAP
jgi:hypothetical protein